MLHHEGARASSAPHTEPAPKKINAADSLKNQIKMEVCLSGCVFSSLIYELENSEGDVVSESLLNISMI